MCSFLILFMVSDVFKALHGRTSLSGLSNTLPQFGIISSWPVIFQVTCLIIWLMTRPGFGPWGETSRSYQSVWLAVSSFSLPLWLNSAVVCLVASDLLSSMISKGTGLVINSLGLEPHLGPRAFSFCSMCTERSGCQPPSDRKEHPGSCRGFSVMGRL